jgi:thiol-disulfide isomerase/thioredoxin
LKLGNLGINLNRTELSILVLTSKVSKGHPLDSRLTVIGLLVITALLAGAWWKFRTGRAKLVKSGKLVDLGKLQADNQGEAVTSFGATATLLQFSTEVCSICIATSRLYKELESKTPGLKHVEVDITHRMDLAAHFSIMQTPTTLILDKHGMVRARIGGAPRQNVIEEELAKLGEK